MARGAGHLPQSLNCDSLASAAQQFLRLNRNYSFASEQLDVVVETSFRLPEPAPQHEPGKLRANQLGARGSFDSSDTKWMKKNRLRLCCVQTEPRIYSGSPSIARYPHNLYYSPGKIPAGENFFGDSLVSCRKKAGNRQQKRP